MCRCVDGTWFWPVLVIACAGVGALFALQGLRKQSSGAFSTLIFFLQCCLLIMGNTSNNAVASVLLSSSALSLTSLEAHRPVCPVALTSNVAREGFFLLPIAVVLFWCLVSLWFAQALSRRLQPSPPPRPSTAAEVLYSFRSFVQQHGAASIGVNMTVAL